VRVATNLALVADWNCMPALCLVQRPTPIQGPARGQETKERRRRLLPEIVQSDIGRNPWEARTQNYRSATDPRGDCRRAKQWRRYNHRRRRPRRFADAVVVIDVANSPSFEDQVAMDVLQTAGKKP
jgi:hypothetical protein